MSENAIQRTTVALRDLLSAAIGGDTIFVGPPSDVNAAASKASLFLYHLQPNAELRNQQRLEPLEPDAPGLRRELAAIPLDLRFLITAFGEAGNEPLREPIELLRLGQMIRALHRTTVLTGARLAGQTVRLMPDPISMEELSRVWGLFPDTAYRTSMVYLASPVFVEQDPRVEGPRVTSVRREHGAAEQPPDVSGRRRERLAQERLEAWLEEQP